MDLHPSSTLWALHILCTIDIERSLQKLRSGYEILLSPNSLFFESYFQLTTSGYVNLIFQKKYILETSGFDFFINNFHI